MADEPRYTRTAITLHWLIALLIFAAFGLGLIMTDMPGFTVAKLKYYSWHKWMGITVFILALCRIVWRLFVGAPDSNGLPIWQQRAARHMHQLLYALIVIIPLSGYFYSLAAGIPVVYFGVIPLPVLIGKNPILKESLQQLHTILNYTMAALVAVHVAAAIKHHFIDRDGTLLRMLPFLKQVQ